MHSSPSLVRHGLSDAEAAERLAHFGPNLIREEHKRGTFAIARGTLREPLFLLLLCATAIYLFLGDLGEGLFLLGGTIVSLGLIVVQEVRSEHALAALNALAAPVVRVVREGRTLSLPAREIVPGDLVIVAEGARVPADGTLVDGDVLTVDESALTGEAATVSKCPRVGPSREDVDPVPGGDMSPNLFAGTLILRGQGTALLTRTGRATRFGRIGAALAGVTEEPTLLQRNIGRLIRRLGVAAIAFCLIVALSYGWLRGDWFQGVLAGITLAIALLPEEFPMVLAVFMALGAWRLARHNVIVRHSAVIETLGATTLLCVDKTGTLTENRMVLECVWKDGIRFDLGNAELAGEARKIVAAALRASAVRPHDPIDAAVHAVATAHEGRPQLRSYALRPDFLAFVQVWPAGDDGSVVYAAKGAPETILRLCGGQDDAIRAAQAQVLALANGGMRVLAVAEARFPADPGSDPAEANYCLVGLLGFADPVRTEVPAALDEARRAGVAVAMITGDYPATALAVARDAGIDTSRGVISGADISGAANLSALIGDVRVFARIMPEQKLALVQNFKAAGHVVAMTGDGINDAPALAAAHIGISMGRRGTDVAREASDLILLDDSFASIVGGIRLGRRIFANLRRAMMFITAIHVPIAGLALLPILLGLPPLLYPVHVVLLELLIDPLCSLVFEGEASEEDAMAKPPRPASEPLFGARHILQAAIHGAVLLAVVLGVYWWSSIAGEPSATARTLAFVALIAGNLSLALTEASAASSRLLDRRRVVFWSIAAFAASFLSLCLAVQPLRDILQLSSLSAIQVLGGLSAGLAAGGWSGAVRAVRGPGRA